jgi:hypothetical protein
MRRGRSHEGFQLRPVHHAIAIAVSLLEKGMALDLRGGKGGLLSRKGEQHDRSENESGQGAPSQSLANNPAWEGTFLSARNLVEN